MQTLESLLTFSIAFLCLLDRGSISAGIVGLVLSSSSAVSGGGITNPSVMPNASPTELMSSLAMSWIILRQSSLVSSMTAMEDLLNYIDIPPEAPLTLGPGEIWDVNKQCPVKGRTFLGLGNVVLAASLTNPTYRFWAASRVRVRAV